MARILVVDDDVEVTGFICESLDNAGYETRAKHDGVEAVLSVLDEKWDGVLLDIRMPKLDGINALRIIRQLKPDLPVLTFTGQAGQGDMVESIRLGAYTCLLKPIRIEELLKTLDLILNTN
jgi:DNA-binding response OmpR family regulator